MPLFQEEVNMTNKELIRTANTLVSTSDLFRCSLVEAWEKYLPLHLTSNFTFHEVKEYVHERIKLGKTYLMS
ncbi:hypothetical protein QTG56_25585 (plasmid) [Rossellomorea sp. AcN35-11]|nr:hypothetical protein [Rossellomorea aquimaris]WJV31988.1 hypothetical protein QTG56_25585 [Rossellomorea sp. AcN35-11]